MTTCVYDSEKSMRRECWQDGVIIHSYDMKTLEPFAKDPIPASQLFFGANIGPWKRGQIVGEASAIK
jgi:hypothetical protein